MPKNCPVSDPHNNAEITNDGSDAVMSMASCEQNSYDSMVYDKLREAELQAENDPVRLSHAEVMSKVRTAEGI